MSFADLFGTRWLRTRWLYARIPYEHFDTVEFKCRTCWRLGPPVSGRHDLFRASRGELTALGAGVVSFPPHGERKQPRWDLVIPLRALALQCIEHHLFHEIEVHWDRAYINDRPLGVTDLAEGRIDALSLTVHGALPVAVAPPLSWELP